MILEEDEGSKSQLIGKIDFMLNDILLGTIQLVSDEYIERLNYKDYYNKLLNNFLTAKYLY